MSIPALVWAMETQSVDDPVDRLILMYLGENAGGGNNDYEAGFSTEKSGQLRLWTGLTADEIVVRLEALAARGVFRILDPDSLHSLAPSCEIDLDKTA